MPASVPTVQRIFWDTPVLQAAERAMDHVAARQQLLASNLANVNTPGYQRLDLPFAGVLARARNRAVELALQHGIPVPSAPINPLQPDSRVNAMPIASPTTMRTDGNTVDPEYELVALAENELRYSMLVRIASGQIRGLLDAITGGRTP